MEQWKKIPSHPDYSTSSDGRIRRIVPDKYNRPCRELKQHLDAGGYLRLCLTTNGVEHTVHVHSLVCEAYHGSRPDGCQVAHKDGIRSNNNQENLRWATPSENTSDKYLHGTITYGENHWSKKNPDLVLRGTANRGGGGKLTDEMVREIRSDHRLLKHIAEQYGVSMVMVSRIRRRLAWAHVI